MQDSIEKYFIGFFFFPLMFYLSKTYYYLTIEYKNLFIIFNLIIKTSRTESFAVLYTFAVELLIVSE